jgi:hypothetical protein
MRKSRLAFLRSPRDCWKASMLANAPKSQNYDGEVSMSVGLIALLDDLAAIAKVAAASLDDVASQAAKAGVKAAGVVIDDAAVTPGYVVGFAAERELPIVGRIAAGSLRNKLLILLPVALALSYFLGQSYRFSWLAAPISATKA